MKNNRKIKDVMTEMMERTGGRRRPCREWVDDITDWCQTDVHRLSLLAQDTGENDYEKCIGHLLALCPWIMMMTMILCVHIHYYIYIFIYTYIYIVLYCIQVFI